MNEYAKQRLIEILRRMEGGRMVTANSLERELSVPRYFIVAALSILEAIGAVKPVITVGKTRVYTLTENGKTLLDALQNNKPIRLVTE